MPALTAADLGTLEEANARFAEALQQEDVAAAIAHDDAFHGGFVARCGNPVVPEVLERVVPVLRRVERLRFASLAGRDSVEQHALIAGHAGGGDAEGAAAASRDNWLSLRYTFTGEEPAAGE